MRIYVAGAWVERQQRAVPVIQKLRLEGFTITHDWTGDNNQVSSAALSDSQLPKEYRLEHARLDLMGVLTAHCVLLLAATERGACGSWVEMGVALGANIPVVIAGGFMNRTIFTELAAANYATDKEGIDRLLRMRDAHRIVGRRAVER